MKFNLRKEFFADREFTLIENNGMKATAFKYSTGVEALKIENSRGYFIILPYQGQQIWRAHFDGRDLQMKTGMEEPQPNTTYLRTYGGFMLHCGVRSIGTPQCYDDKHTQHGEIPNVEYQDAYLEVGDDCMAVGGEYRYDESFVRNYTFRPLVTLGKDSTVFKIHVELENRRTTPMEYMYLCHINFRPIDGAELVYSAKYDSEHIKVLTSPADGAELAAYKPKCAENPSIHHKVGAPGQIYDPEICYTIYYSADENNRAYTLQDAGDFACYVNHPVDALPIGVRWISRTGNEDSMGMILPATSEALGYTEIKNRGQEKYLAGNSTLTFDIEAGIIGRECADKVKAKIAAIVG